MGSRAFWMSILSMLAPIFTLLAAVGLDRWEKVLRQEAAASFDFSAVVPGALVADLIVAALLLLLAWLVAFRREHHRLGAAAALIIGLLAGAYPWVMISAPRLVSAYNDWPILRELRVAILDSGLGSRFTLLAGFVLLAGLLGLIRSQPRAERI
jgi:multisubunit Na+/H+ antiporter MnhG subunit